MKTYPREQIVTMRTILFDVSTELRALAYLFETQGPKANHKRQVRRLRRAHAVVDKL